MARSIWKGSISFGLVNIPINLFTAVESHRVGFHELERETHARIRYKRVSEATGKEIPWKDIESGYELRKGRYVVLTDEELAAAAPRRAHTIDVEHFVPLTEIDPVNWDQSYYVAADGPAAAKAYALLRQSMEKAGRVAIGRFVLRTREYVVCIRPMGKVLALHTMFFPDEVRKPADLDIEPPKAAAGKQELALAEKLIEMLSAPWEPQAYEDTYRERVLELVRKKDRGEEISAPAEERAPKVVDLMEALKASLAGTKTAPVKRAAAPRRRRQTRGHGAKPRSDASSAA